MKTKYSKYILLAIILLVPFIFLYIYNYSSYQEGFLDTIYQKTIYLVWRNKIKNSGTNHGLGDKLRGAVFLYQYCNENKINLKIDATDDICSDYLKNVTSNDYPIIKGKPLINVGDQPIENVKETIQNELSTKNTIYLYSNAWPNDLSDKDKEFAKKICEPVDSLTLEINEKMRDLPMNFGIQHFRFHDKVFQKDVDSTDILFKKYYELLKSGYKSTDILFTNSNNFKKYVKETLGMKTIDCNNALCKIEHIGESSEKESVKNSFVEFFIISKASYIKSHTCYQWPSNFVHWPAKMYNIPFDNVYVDEKNMV